MNQLPEVSLLTRAVCSAAYASSLLCRLGSRSRRLAGRRQFLCLLLEQLPVANYWCVVTWNTACPIVASPYLLRSLILHQVSGINKSQQLLHLLREMNRTALFSSQYALCPHHYPSMHSLPRRSASEPTLAPIAFLKGLLQTNHADIPSLPICRRSSPNITSAGLMDI
jgi:hypothetical protein